MDDDMSLEPIRGWDYTHTPMHMANDANAVVLSWRAHATIEIMRLLLPVIGRFPNQTD